MRWVEGRVFFFWLLFLFFDQISNFLIVEKIRIIVWRRLFNNLSSYRHDGTEESKKIIVLVPHFHFTNIIESLNHFDQSLEKPSANLSYSLIYTKKRFRSRTDIVKAASLCTSSWVNGWPTNPNFHEHWWVLTYLSRDHVHTSRWLAWWNV